MEINAAETNKWTAPRERLIPHEQNWCSLVPCKYPESACKMTGYGLEDRDSIPGRSGDFSLSHHAKTGSRAYPVFFAMDTRDSFHGVCS
jgi:hypothetical protein